MYFGRLYLYVGFVGRRLLACSKVKVESENEKGKKVYVLKTKIVSGFKACISPGCTLEI